MLRLLQNLPKSPSFGSLVSNPKVRLANPVSKYVVRYGSMRSLGVMTAKDAESYSRGNEVIVRSSRGIETGLVLCEATDDALSQLDQPPVGHILREMTDEDANELAHIEDSKERMLEVCQKHVDQLQLDMQLVELEQLLGGERIVVFYLAEDRVDFRDLVKMLASEFQTRIEMRQIGVRDEAKILADYGDCGRPVCCNTFLSKMPPVSMKMAKIQKATLDPTKISGRCGRLKCCLRYEYDTYDEIQKQLPRIGANILTRDGKARVIGREILAEQLLVEMEDHRRVVIDAGEVLSIVKGGQQGKSDSPPREFAEKNTGPARKDRAENRPNEAIPDDQQQKADNESDDSTLQSNGKRKKSKRRRSRTRKSDRGAGKDDPSSPEEGKEQN